MKDSQIVDAIRLDSVEASMTEMARLLELFKRHKSEGNLQSNTAAGILHAIAVQADNARAAANSECFFIKARQ